MADQRRLLAELLISIIMSDYVTEIISLPMIVCNFFFRQLAPVAQKLIFS